MTKNEFHAFLRTEGLTGHYKGNLNGGIMYVPGKVIGKTLWDYIRSKAYSCHFQVEIDKV
jgi:hypothetical protein